MEKTSRIPDSFVQVGTARFYEIVHISIIIPEPSFAPICPWTLVERLSPPSVCWNEARHCWAPMGNIGFQ